MPLPTTMTCAGSCPEPEPCTIETLSSRGASARMIRLYSGTYVSVSGLARAMPSSISGTNCFGSLTNFFTAASPSDSASWFHASLIRSTITATAIAPASTEPLLRSPV